MSERVRPVGAGLPAGAVSSTRGVELADGWSLTSTAPGLCAGPAELPADLLWQPALVPGTVAAARRPDTLDGHEDYDASDWWYRCTLAAPERDGSDDRIQLRFDGLATVASVWFNGTRVLDSSNMFLAHRVDVTDLVGPENDVVIVFRSLGHALGERRPRPRWKTRLVEQQQLRWFRTTLLGRIPGWTPAIAPVGPWRPVHLEIVSGVDVEALDVRVRVDGRAGVVDARGTIGALAPGVSVESARLRIGATDHELTVAADADGWTVEGTARIEDVALWWPRTHGEPTLHDCALELATSAGPVGVACGRIGFRDVRVDRDGGRIRFVVNGVPVFCRGSCWTTADVVSLVGSPEDVRATLELAAEGNANMIRVGGTMVYESDAFYDACDELGLMVWQDFMFANMDYPADDADFVSGVEDEARYQVGRLARHPSLVAFCGGSEVEQQAAMFGVDRSLWSNRVFSEALPAMVAELSAGTPYWPSTPTGGALPFQTGEGLTHYYGVGAYKRPLTDVRLAGVRFTPECLGFSNVPEPSNLRGLTPTGAVPPHHPAWKAGVPRDTGPGWDFEDVRDHYLGTRYGVRPGVLRGEDLERYLGLSRIVTGEVMERVFDEWRSENDGCGGALTWFLNDLRPGAGWGIIDSDREPKAVYHYLRRAWAPVACRILDRGLDGLVVSVLNERSSDLEAVLEVAVVARGSTVVAEARESIRVAGRARLGVGVESLLGHFVDSTYAYRFGPPRHEAVVATLVDEDGAVVSQDVYRPLPALMNDRGSLALEAEAAESGHVRLTLRADALLYGVRIEARDHRPEDNYFDLIPGRARTVLLRPISDGGASLRGSVEAVNLADAVRLPRV